MNKHIEELFRQACWDQTMEQDLENFINVEKFAELIVQECCDVGEQWGEELLATKHHSFVNKKIREHFGVEV